MESFLISQPFDQVSADALAIIVFQEEAAAPAELSTVSDWLEELNASGEFSGKPGELAILHLSSGLASGLASKRLVVVGGGKRDGFDSAALRKAVASASRSLKQKGVKTLAWWIGAGSAPGLIEAAIEGGILGNYEVDVHKTSSKDSKSLDSFSVAVPELSGSIQSAFARGNILAEAQNFTRTLANEPANLMTPAILADRARAMCAEFSLDCEVLDQDRMRQLGMGSLLGVAQGSAEPPALIIVRYKPVRYRPAAPPSSSDHLGLIGKGVTFDTGGVSIKPADGMEKMKYDMSGGAAVLGAMRAIAQLKPAIPVTALVPAVENMVGSKAQRPGDIVTSLAGKTIEVLNTDAEGRLILIDALTYAQRLGCTHLVDAATLTGAIVVALGHVNIGAFTNNDALLGRVMASAKAEGEKAWQMPMDDEYKDLLKSPFADLANIGGRPGGAISAAWFIREFAGDTPWVHLDIAGTAWLDDAKPFMPKGPTGVCVRTFANLAMNW